MNSARKILHRDDNEQPVDEEAENQEQPSNELSENLREFSSYSRDQASHDQMNRRSLTNQIYNQQEREEGKNPELGSQEEQDINQEENDPRGFRSKCITFSMKGLYEGIHKFPWKKCLKFYIRTFLEAFLILVLTSYEEIRREPLVIDASKAIAYVILSSCGVFFIFVWAYFLFHFRNYREERDYKDYVKPSNIVIPGNDQIQHNASEEVHVTKEELLKKANELNTKRVFGELFAGLRPNRIARIFYPMVLLRKIVFVLIIHVLKLEEQFAFAVLLSYQIVYWICTILYQNFIYGSIEFMIQQINEVFLTCLILYLMIHQDEREWGVTTNNPWPKNIALVVITMNTCLVLFFQLVINTLFTGVET